MEKKGLFLKKGRDPFMYVASKKINMQNVATWPALVTFVKKLVT